MSRHVRWVLFQMRERCLDRVRKQDIVIGQQDDVWGVDRPRDPSQLRILRYLIAK
jgi:hypothetical protein